MSKVIPVISEGRLEEIEWTCECGVKTHGGHCHECESPHPQGMVVIPDGEDGQKVINMLKNPRRCGNCIHFDLRTGQEIVQNPKDPFLIKMQKEMGLKSITERIDFSRLGLCRFWTDNIKENRFWVPDTAPAQVHRKRLDSSTPYKLGDESVDCPEFSPRSSDGKVVKSYRQVPGSRTRGTD